MRANSLLIILAATTISQSHGQASGVWIESHTSRDVVLGPLLQVGDRLIRWHSDDWGSAGHALRSYADFVALELEYAPRGPIRIRVERDSESFETVLKPWHWRIDVRPFMSESQLSIYLRGREKFHAGKTADGLSMWRALRRQANDQANPDLSFWVSLKMGAQLSKSGDWDQAASAFASALKSVISTDNPTVKCYVLEKLAVAHLMLRQFDEAERIAHDMMRVAEESERYPLARASAHCLSAQIAKRRHDAKGALPMLRTALDLRSRFAPNSFIHMQTWYDIGLAEFQLGQMQAAREAFEEASRISQSMAPTSAIAARCLNAIGAASMAQGKYDQAETHHLKALAIRRDLDNPADEAASLNNLGCVTWYRGDLDKAETYFTQATKVFETLAPDSENLAAAYQNLGTLAEGRGDLASADKYHRKALNILQEIVPGGVQHASSLNNLGVVAERLGDLALAEETHLKALAMREKIAPGSLDVAYSLENLGNVMAKKGELKRAKANFLEALEIRQEHAPQSMEVAMSLYDLGMVCRKLGDLGMAEVYLKQGLDVCDRQAPANLIGPACLEELGAVARARDDLKKAESHYLRASQRIAKCAPGSHREATIHHGLGITHRLEGKHETALNDFIRAIDALEHQIERIGGSQEQRAGFTAGAQYMYRDAIDMALALDRSHLAFGLFERSRARVLLEMLSQRDLVFANDVAGDLFRKRKHLNAELDRLLTNLYRTHPDVPEAERLRSRIRHVQQQQTHLKAALIEASPRWAAMTIPNPVTLSQAFESLDPGTVALLYSVGREETILFVLDANEKCLSVHHIPITRNGLTDRIEEFRLAIRSRLPVIRKHADRMRDLLLGPARSAILRAERLVIVPDGMLHLLPFSVLSDLTQPQDDFRFLIESFPISTTVSLTLNRALRSQTPNADSAIDIVAFGHPKVGGGLTDDTHLLRSGSAPLPMTRRELTAIRRVFPQAQVFFGDQATETRVKNLDEAADIIHFACHGVINERFPLESALILASAPPADPDRDNGILQVWEVFEDVRIDADLVVLSACETGLGKRFSGQGLLGLTSAFHHAGAQSVVASLWAVSDISTAELMGRLYTYLSQGLPTDRALQKAQIDLIHTPIETADQTGSLDASHPDYWGGFILSGRWR